MSYDKAPVDQKKEEQKSKSAMGTDDDLEYVSGTDLKEVLQRLGRGVDEQGSGHDNRHIK